MELLTLSLENFQGLKHEEIQLDGHSASIYGRNASGKTTSRKAASAQWDVAEPDF